MSFQITRDAKGKPVNVFEDTGFMQISRAFEPDKDGWMEDQLKFNEFPGIQLGRDTEWLVREVNRLRRENFELHQRLDSYDKLTLFGGGQ